MMRSRFAVSTLALSSLLCIPAAADEPAEPEPVAQRAREEGPGPVVPVRAGYLKTGYSYAMRRIEPDDTRNFDPFTLRNHLVFVEGGHRLWQDWEGYLRVGGASVGIRKAFDFADGDQRDFESEAWFGTLGIRWQVVNRTRYAFSSYFEATQFTDFEDDQGGSVRVAGIKGPVQETLEFKSMREFNLGIDGQTRWGGLSVFGGPFLYRGRADAKDRLSDADLRDAVVVTQPKFSTTYEETGLIGLRLGLKYDLGNGYALEGEAGYRSRAYFEIAVARRF